MDKARVIQLLGWRLGDRDDMAERIEVEMDTVQETVLEQNIWLPWFLLKAATGLVTTAGVQTLALPADFLLEEEGERMWVQLPSGVWQELVKSEYPSPDTGEVSTGVPVEYCLRNNLLYLFPTPDGEYPLKWMYNGKATLISSDTETSPWLVEAGDVVLAELGKLLAMQHLRDQALAAAFQADAEVAWRRLFTKNEARKEINRTHYMGGGY